MIIKNYPTLDNMNLGALMVAQFTLRRFIKWGYLEENNENVNRLAKDIADKIYKCKLSSFTNKIKRGE